jgi:hypothetical protein
MFFNGMLSNFALILSDAFKLLEEKFMRLGRGYDHFWWVSAAYSIVQAKLEPELAEEIKLQATERVAELYRKKLAHIETNSLTQHEADTASMHNNESTEGNWTSVS